MTVWLSIIAGIGVALFGGGGFFFTILRYHRDEATKVIAQHSAILDDMRELYQAMKAERDEYHEENVRLHQQVSKLTRKVNELEQALERYIHG